MEEVFGMTKDRYLYLSENKKEKLTWEELDNGWHFCKMWGNILIHETWPEIRMCECTEKDKEESMVKTYYGIRNKKTKEPVGIFADIVRKPPKSLFIPYFLQDASAHGSTLYAVDEEVYARDILKKERKWFESSLLQPSTDKLIYQIEAYEVYVVRMEKVKEVEDNVLRFEPSKRVLNPKETIKDKFTNNIVDIGVSSNPELEDKDGSSKRLNQLEAQKTRRSLETEK